MSHHLHGQARSTGRLPIAIVVAAGAFTFLFLHPGDGFWIQLAGTATGLSALAILLDAPGMRSQLRRPPQGWIHSILTAVLAAAALYGIFLVGRAISVRILSAASSRIADIYELKGSASERQIAAWLLLVIGPCEEFFWRGYVQRSMQALFGLAGVAGSALLYAAVHVSSGNLMLVGAALVCGLFWGGLYAHFRSLWINALCHALWALVIFVLWPIPPG